jgi:hypothetical protein
MSMRYVYFRIPKSVGPGRVLCHNHVKHTSNDFRAWTDAEPPPNFVKCPCGWSGLPHYAKNFAIAGRRARVLERT